MLRYIKVGNELEYRDTLAHRDEGIYYEVDENGFITSYWQEDDEYHELGKLVDETDERPSKVW